MKKGENVKLYALSVDAPDVSKTFAAKIAADGKGAVSFPILSDPDHKIIDAYGLRDPAYAGQKSGGIPHPAVYVVDNTRRVTWAKIEFGMENPMKTIPAPRFQTVEVEPFTREGIVRMLRACIYSREEDTQYRKQFVMRRPTANRDQAILLTLFDSGIRASEFCALRIEDFEAKRGKLEICHGGGGGAKGGKGRIFYLGENCPTCGVAIFGWDGGWR